MLFLLQSTYNIQGFHLLLMLQSCLIKWYKNKLRPICIHIGGSFETLNFLHVSSCKMILWRLTWNNTKNTTKLSRVHNTNWIKNFLLSFSIPSEIACHLNASRASFFSN